jgi:hypothetical protein
MNRSSSVGARMESLESRWLLSGIDQVSGIGYLLSDNGAKFQRYDISNQQWLAPISLAGSTGGATASLVDSDGIYVAYDRSIIRYGLDGSGPTHLMNTNSTVHGIHSDGNLLFLNQTSGLYARFISINKNTNTIIDTMENYVDSVYGSSISTTANKIFGRSAGISPADITYAAYDDNGNFGAAGDSPYHGAYPSASRTWVFPLGTKVVDDSGGVYSTANLTRLNSFGTMISDIAFLGSDVPIVLSGNTLTAYSSTILPAGSKTLAAPATEILVNSTNVIAFNPDATKPNRYTTQIVSLADLKAPTPGQPVNPVGLAYTPDDIEIAANNTLLLLDKETQSLFRWNPETQTYSATIPLLDVPNYMAYSTATNTVYLAYASGLINSIDLGATTLVEKPFAVLATGPLGLSTAGQYLFAADGSGAWMAHYTFAPNGTQISYKDWNYYSTEYIWSAVNSRMYHFRDSTSPNDLLSEAIGVDGKLGATLDSPLHDSAGFQHPIRVSPDGKIVILGSGVVHDATTLARQPGGLPNSVSDISWMQGSVYTVRNLSGNSQFQQWTGSTFAPGAVAQVQGTPVGLFTIADSKLVGIYMPPNGIPAFRVMDGSLQPPPATPSLAISAMDASKIEGNSGPAAFTFNVTRTGPTSGATTVNWAVSPSGANPASAADFVDGVLPGGTVNFAAGETIKTISVNVNGDADVELDETFTVTLSGPSGGAQITTPSGSGTIVNDDTAIVIAAADANKAEGNSDTTPFTFTVSRMGLTTGVTTVNWSVAGSGLNPADANDFGGVLPTGVLTFAPDETSKLLSILVSADATAEPEEGFTVTLAGSDGTVIVGSPQSGLIINDDTALAIAPADAGKAEGNSGSTPFTFTVTRSGLSSGITTATWMVAGSGAAPADAADFTGGVLPGGIVSFAAGVTTQTITVLVNGDTSLEGDEGFTVALSDASGGAQIASPTAAGSISNDDAIVIQPMVIQSESGVFSGGARSRNHYAGFTGAGYADYGGKRSAATYRITRTSAGASKFTFRYANGSKFTSQLQVFVNDSLAGSLSLAPTGGWEIWKTVSLDGVQMPAGAVTIKTVASSKGPGVNIDRLTISDTISTPILKVEAQTQQLPAIVPDIFSKDSIIPPLTFAPSASSNWEILSREDAEFAGGVHGRGPAQRAVGKPHLFRQA